ncbi:uncharacterized protein LOC116253977 [Nymphaea colorata]|uniref:Uncharacterized protein n=1 Tax=Nymphaea colorata TaxID=210225 RepID=A0A5K1DVJ0_9MAGN|nr:uncharacterized protein LOC116253977 [Nymphaea colorata]
MGSSGYSFYGCEVSEDSQSQPPLGKLTASEGPPIIFDDDAESCSGDLEHPTPWPEADEKRDDSADDQQIRGFRSGVGREKAAGGKAAIVQPKAQENVLMVDLGAFRRDCYTGSPAEGQIADDEDDAPGRCHFTAEELMKREMERNRLFWEACLAKW